MSLRNDLLGNPRIRLLRRVTEIEKHQRACVLEALAQVEESRVGGQQNIGREELLDLTEHRLCPGELRCLFLLEWDSKRFEEDHWLPEEDRTESIVLPQGFDHLDAGDVSTDHSSRE